MPVDIHTRQMAELLDLTHRWMEDYPDLGKAAETEARRLLRQYQLPLLDVHQVHWHRFDNAQSSPQAFTGWAHNGPPVESLSLPQLVMRRFAPQAQDSLDQLDVLSGFYLTGADNGLYDQTRELALLPSQVSAEFWHTGFAERYGAALDDFWRTRSEDFIALSRASALVSLGHARNDGLLDSKDLATVQNALAPGMGQQLSIRALGGQRRPRAGTRVTGLRIAGSRARHVLRIYGPEGTQYLYTPGSRTAFYRFQNDNALAAWLTAQARTAEGLDHLRNWFDPADTLAKATLTQMAAGQLPPGWLSAAPIPSASDPFAWLAERARAEMLQHAHQALTSNSRLRKEAAIAFLSTLSGLAVNLAPAGWPVALVTVVSASLTLGLEIDKAIGARSVAERNQALWAAVGEGITALLGLPLLVTGEIADWPWEVDDQEESPTLTGMLEAPRSPVSPLPLNSRGMIERTDVELLFIVHEAAREASPARLLREGLTPTARFDRVPAMIERPALRAFGNAEGALAYAKANFDGPFHLFRLQARGLKTAALRLNLRHNRINTLALLGREERELTGGELEQLADGAWLEHEVHVAASDLHPARLRLLSPLSRQPWQRASLDVLRGVQQQHLNNVAAPGYLIETDDSLRLVRFDPFSRTWRSTRGTAFHYNAALGGFEVVDPASIPEALAPEIEAATTELGMPATYPWRIPELPAAGRLPIPRAIHSIWLGHRMPGRLVDNLLRNVAQAGEGSAPFEYHLYLALNDPLDHALTLQDLAGAPANLHVHELEQTAFFQSFAQSPYYQQYVAATGGSGINYASATDVLRYRLLHYYGGLYMDVDDVIYAGTGSHTRFSEQPWAVAPGRLLLNGLVSEPRLGLHCGFNTSNFASLPGNPLLEAISEESYARYLANRDLYYQRPYEGADSRERVTAYARRINHVTGPGVFNDVLMAQQPDVRQFRSVCRIATELYVPARHLAGLHQQIRARTAQYCPLAWRIRIGATSSWLHTR